MKTKRKLEANHKKGKEKQNLVREVWERIVLLPPKDFDAWMQVLDPHPAALEAVLRCSSDADCVFRLSKI